MIKKLTQQYVDSFRVIDRVDRLFYLLNLSDHWRVHLVFTIAQLKFFSLSMNDLFERDRSTNSSFVFVNENIETLKSFKIERFLNKRIIRKDCDRATEYLIRWKDWDSKWEKWMNIKQFDNVSNLIKNYDAKQDLMHQRDWQRDDLFSCLFVRMLSRYSRLWFIDESRARLASSRINT